MCINSTCITFSPPSKLLPVSTTHPGPHNALVTRLRYKLCSFYYKFGLASVSIPGLEAIYTKPPARVLGYSWCWNDYKFSFFPSPPALSLLLVYWTPARSKQTYWQSVWVIFRMCMCACVCLVHVLMHAWVKEREKLFREHLAGSRKMRGSLLCLFVLQQSPCQHLITWFGDWTSWLGPGFSTHPVGLWAKCVFFHVCCCSFYSIPARCLGCWIM